MAHAQPFNVEGVWDGTEYGVEDLFNACMWSWTTYSGRRGARPPIEMLVRVCGKTMYCSCDGLVSFLVSRKD